MYKIKPLIAISLVTLFVACEKQEEPVVPPTPGAQQAVDVLNTNSGFNAVYDYIQNVQGIEGSLIGNLDLTDFTVEGNSTLHYVRSFGSQYQQSYLIYNSRVSIDLNTKEEIPQPSYTAYFFSDFDKNNKADVVIYKPYTNYASIIKSTTQCSGDISANGGTVLNFGKTEFDFFYPQFNLGKVYDNSPLSQTTYIFAGLQNPPNPTLYGCTAQTYNFTNPSPSQVILGGLFDWKRTDAPVKIHGFILRNDSLIVYNCNTTSLQKINGVNVAGLSENNEVTAFRNYSSDGNIIGLVFKETTSNKYWSYSYNFTTQVLTKGVENVTLDYAATGSDVDADEFGNIYYSGIAGNGSNSNGVSIYKKDGNGGNTLVGSDNFLKFGTISKLKSIGGKVYLVITGTISGTTYKQITFLKQN